MNNTRTEGWKVELASFVTKKRDEGGFTIAALTEYVNSLLQTQRKEMVEEVIKYVRSGETGGAFAEGCDCERCNKYEEKVRTALLNKQPT